MAFPVTITTGGDCLEGGAIPYKSSAGNIYVIVRDDVTTSKFRAFKATDPTTSFANVGTDPALTAGHVIRGMATCQVGDVIHVVTEDANSGASLIQSIKYHTFNMATDAWVITNEAVVTSATAAFTISGQHIAIAVRSTGDVIVLYNGAAITTGVARDRVYYARRVAAVWTVDVLVDNGGSTSWYANTIVKGSSDRMHFFFFDDGNDDQYQRCLTSANVLQAFPASYDSTTSTINPLGGLQQGVSYVSGAATKVRAPYGSITSNKINGAKCDSADTPTMSTDASINGARAVSNVSAYANAYAADGTTLYNACIDTLSDIYTESNINDAGWSTPALFYTGTVAAVYANIYSRGGNFVLAMVFSESGDPKYTESVLRSDGSGAFSDVPAASVTWAGASRVASPFSDTAAASVTWDGHLYKTGDFSSAATALAVWNGKSFAASAWNPIAAASVTWVGNSFAASVWNPTALALVNWVGASRISAGWQSTAAALVTWNGVSIAAAAWQEIAAASVTWVGAAIAASATAADWQSIAAASLTWNGASINASAWQAVSAASLTWNGASINATAWQAIAAASVTWNGASIAASDWQTVAAAALTWNGSSVVSVIGDWQSTTAASLTWNGVSTAASAMAVIAGALLLWDGASIRAAALQALAAANEAWDGAAVGTSSSVLSTNARAIASWGGANATPHKGLSDIDRDGWKPRKRYNEEQNEKDVMELMTVINIDMGSRYNVQY